MAYNQNHEPRLETPAELPLYIDTQDLAASLEWTPHVVANGLPNKHVTIFYANEQRDDLKTMSDEDVVRRAADKDYVCSLRAFQRGYNYFESVTLPSGLPGIRPNTFTGAIETQVLAAKHKHHPASEQQVIAEVERIMEPAVQNALRDTLFSRIKEASAPSTNPHKFKAFVELIHEYDPPYAIEEGRIPASELAMMVFDYQKQRATGRGVTDLEQKRLRTVFDAIGANNLAVQADKHAIVHNRRRLEVERPQALVDKALRRLTGKPRARTLERVDDHYTKNFSGYLGDVETVSMFMPRPTLSQEAAARALSEAARLKDIDPAKATKHAAVAGLVAGGLFGTQNVAAAERPQTSLTFQVDAAPTVELNAQNVASFSAMPNLVEKAKTSKEILYGSASERALDAMIAEYKRKGDSASVRATQILRFYMKEGMPLHQALGMVGNFGPETAGTFDPKIKQGYGGPGRGLAQWGLNADGGRFNLCIKFAKKRGLDPYSLTGQLEFSMYELRNTQKEAFAQLKKSDNVREAVYAVGKYYERPANLSASIDSRNRYAARYQNSFMSHYDADAGAATASRKTTPTPKAATPVVKFDVTSVFASTEENAPAVSASISADTVFAMPDEYAPERPVSKFNIDAVKANLDALLGVMPPTQFELAPEPSESNAQPSVDTPVQAKLSSVALQNIFEQAPQTTTPVAAQPAADQTATPNPPAPSLPPVESILSSQPSNPNSSTPEASSENPQLAPALGGIAVNSEPETQEASAIPTMLTLETPKEAESLAILPITETTTAEPIVVTTTPEASINDIPVETKPQTPAPDKPKEIAPKVEAPKQDKKVETTQDDRKAKQRAEVARLKSSSNFRGSQALSDKDDKAPRTPIEARLKAEGEKNGKLGNDDLVRVGEHWGDAKLHPSAAASFRELDAAFYKKFKHHIPFNGSISDYRSYESQEEVYNDPDTRPGFAAKPGGSNHGWGVAADIGKGWSFNHREYKWMIKNAINYGWVHPQFAAQPKDGGSFPEPWHWEFWGRTW